MFRRLLIVEDEASVQELLSEYLRGRGYEVVVCADGRQARAALMPGRFDLLITDLQLPDAEGVDLVRAAWALDPPLPSVVISGYASVETAVAAMSNGAVDLLLKPFRLREAHTALERALATAANQRETAIRLLLAEWYERAALVDRPEEAVEALEALLVLLRGAFPGVSVEIGDRPPGPVVADGWVPIGARRSARAPLHDDLVRAALRALHDAFVRAGA